MADKSVTIMEPTASDVEALTIIFDGAGNPVSVEVACIMQTSDDDVRHSGSCTTAPGDYSAESQVEMSAMAIVAATKVAASKGFPV